jgi:hypothetical protein
MRSISIQAFYLGSGVAIRIEKSMVFFRVPEKKVKMMTLKRKKNRDVNDSPNPSS